MTLEDSVGSSRFRLPFLKNVSGKDKTRALWVLMVILLLVSIVQVMWWHYDQTVLINRHTDQMTRAYSQEVAVAEDLLARGADKTHVEALLPQIQVDDQDNAMLHPGVIAQLNDERNRRTLRYVYESAFFILVLCAGIGVLWRALSAETRIRKDQDNFLMMVSHEFKTPLASLQLAAETMLRRTPSPDDLERKLRRMLGDLGRMQNMVSKILDSARLQQGQVHLTLEPVHLMATVVKALNAFEQDPLRPKIHYDVSIPVDLYVMADALALETVLLNVFENAHEAMRPSGSGTLTVRAERHGDAVHLSARDSGIGFASAKGTVLFDKFYRTDDAYCGDKKGTGLGLFIVSRLMHLQHGKASAYSDGVGLGLGATVQLTLPHSSVNA